MGPRFHRNRQECLQDLFPLRRLTVDGDGPALIIGDRKEQSTGFCGSTVPVSFVSLQLSRWSGD